jgi:hypothetical protein
MSTLKTKTLPKKDTASVTKKAKSAVRRRAAKTGSISPELRKLASGFKQLADQACQAYAPLIEDIIGAQCRDTQRIEHLLNGMLGFCFDDKMLAIFKRLCRYYYVIDPAATAAHVYAYRNMWDEKSLIDDKVKNGISKLVNSSDTVGRIRATGRKEISAIKKSPSVKLLTGILNPKSGGISAIEREQLKKLKKSPKKLILDE